jgi:hypothetical protein
MTANAIVGQVNRKAASASSSSCENLSAETLTVNDWLDFKPKPHSSG